MGDVKQKPCGKKIFGTELEAMFAVQDALRSKKQKRNEIRYYKCWRCGNGKKPVWHLTSQIKNQNRN